MRTYFDSAAFIYLVEQIAPWYGLVVAKLASVPHKSVITDLTRMECQVLPIRLGFTSILAEYHNAFSMAEVAPLSPAVFDRAARIRAAYNFKTPDSIHLAAAVEAGCDAFLTNDHGLAKFTGIKVELI